MTRDVDQHLLNQNLIRTKLGVLTQLVRVIMAEIEIPCFTTFTVNSGERVKVTVPEETVFNITSISINLTDDLPASGRAVVYTQIVDDEEKAGPKVAIAPLRIAQNEVITVDYAINSFSPIIFSVEGDKFGVNIIGYTTTAQPLVTEKIE